jgi:oligopeptidase B
MPTDARLQIAPPKAARHPKELVAHGDLRIDPYYWLNERENPEMTAYLEAENAYTQAMLAHTATFQEELYQEIIGRIKQEDQSVPYLDNGYYYITRYEEGREYPIYSRKKGSLEAAECQFPG